MLYSLLVLAALAKLNAAARACYDGNYCSSCQANYAARYIWKANLNGGQGACSCHVSKKTTKNSCKDGDHSDNHFCNEATGLCECHNGRYSLPDSPPSCDQNCTSISNCKPDQVTCTTSDDQTCGECVSGYELNGDDNTSCVEPAPPSTAKTVNQKTLNAYIVGVNEKQQEHIVNLETLTGVHNQTIATLNVDLADLESGTQTDIANLRDNITSQLQDNIAALADLELDINSRGYQSQTDIATQRGVDIANLQANINAAQDEAERKLQELDNKVTRQTTVSINSFRKDLLDLLFVDGGFCTTEIQRLDVTNETEKSCELDCFDNPNCKGYKWTANVNACVLFEGVSASDVDIADGSISECTLRIEV